MYFSSRIQLAIFFFISSFFLFPVFLHFSFFHFPSFPHFFLFSSSYFFPFFLALLLIMPFFHSIFFLPPRNNQLIYFPSRILLIYFLLVFNLLSIFFTYSSYVFSSRIRLVIYFLHVFSLSSIFFTYSTQSIFLLVISVPLIITEMQIRYFASILFRHSSLLLPMDIQTGHNR